MNVGLYFGSFNPIHTGHLIIANHVLNETGLQKIWMVVSPQNPLKKSESLLNEYDRFHLVRKAIDGDERLRASDIEFSLPKPSYTIDTLAYLSERYPEHRFAVIMGSDSYQNLSKWKNHETLLAHYQILVYLRPGFPVQTQHPNVRILDAPLLQISATHIRTLLQEGKSIRYLVPPTVEEEIRGYQFYKKNQKK